MGSLLLLLQSGTVQNRLEIRMTGLQDNAYLSDGSNFDSDLAVASADADATQEADLDFETEGSNSVEAGSSGTDTVPEDAEECCRRMREPMKRRKRKEKG